MKSNFSEILNCQTAFEFQCPKAWNSLIETHDSGIRHCDVCNQNVHICFTPEDFIENGKLGRCVAVPQELLPGNPAGVYAETFSGRPSLEEAQRLEQLYSQCKQWWDDALVQGSLSFSKFAGNSFSILAYAYIAENDFRRVVTLVKLLSDKHELVDILTEAGESLIAQKQVKLARAFLIKAYNLIEIKSYNYTKLNLILALIKVKQFDEALNVARLLRSKRSLGEIADWLKSKGELLESQRFIDLLYTIDYDSPTE